MTSSAIPLGDVNTVGDVLAYFHSEVVRAVAISYAVANAFPEQILNEIRASMTHLAKANDLGEGHKDYQTELKASWRHLKRTCLDCFKLSIFSIAKRADDQITQLLEIHALPNTLIRQTSELKVRRIALMTNEAQTPTHVAVEEYKKLFQDYDEFWTVLSSEYGGESAELVARGQTKKAWKDRGFGFILGILTSAIVSATFAWGSGTFPFN